jgi:8-oxo-dGTP diphosphatase
MTLAHAYPDRDVELHLHVVPEFGGEPRGLDGQQIKWVPLDQLGDEDLLEADRPFIDALQRHRPSAR